MEELNIYQRMSAATEEITTVGKNLEVGYGSSKYKAVSEADVLAAVKPIERKYGIYSFPVSRQVISSDVMAYKNSKGEDKTNLFLRIETVYRFVNIDKPSEFVDITTYGDGIDSQDKAPGKAMTYGDKYALLKAYKIQTGDDPDARASEEMRDFTSHTQEQAYPTPDEMIKAIEAHYPKGEVRIKLLKALNVESVAKMSKPQMMAVYNKVRK